MWFAALGDYHQNPWLIHMMASLLQGSSTPTNSFLYVDSSKFKEINIQKQNCRGTSPVLDLFKSNPFKDKPPRYIRAIVYEYSFTDFATKQKTKAWWQREFKGSYTPVLSFTTQALP